MPKISDLPADTAPDSADLIPFVDVDAARTESVTVANLAASAAFTAAYAPLPTRILVPARSMATRNSSSGTVTLPTVTSYVQTVATAADAGAGNEDILGPHFDVPSGWATFTVSVIAEASAAATGDFRIRASIITVTPNGTANFSSTTVWEDTVTPTADAGGGPTVFTIANAAAYTVVAGKIQSPVVRRVCTDAADTNTGVFRIHAVVLEKAS